MNKQRTMSLFDFETPFSTGSIPDWLLKTGDPNRTFPPYNIDLIGENHVKITLAVAGYSMEDLNITLDRDTKGERVLSISGKPPKQLQTNETVVNVAKGIATRSFNRSFALHRYLEVKGASLVNGILEILLTKHTPEEEKPLQIPISTNYPRLE